MNSIDTDDAVGRRERKKLATHRALHEAAWSLAEERGMSNVTIEAITERADVATRTFFNHFASKEDAVIGPRPDPAKVAAALSAMFRAGHAPLAALHAALLEDLLDRDPTSQRLRRRMAMIRKEPAVLAVAAAHWEELASRLVATVAEATTLDPAADVYPTLVVHVSIAAVRSALLQWVEDPHEPLTEVVGRAFALVAAGMAAPVGAGR